MSRNYSFDPACEALAFHFLSPEHLRDDPDASRVLAQDIQDAVENYFASRQTKGETT